ncbi:hypothetical protein ACES2I_05330 [Bdellovibrio bacteriovorus]|uniref:hypothetical protein n=1 Tax=Bdellovibrio bacteriovorus TaxID=959 RepID=UPI0035A6BDF6
MKSLLLIVISLGLVSCSFDNGKFSPVVKTVSAKKELTNSQKDLIAAARIGNVDLVQKSIDKLKVHEFAFAGFAETPMGAALAGDNVDVAKVLWSQSVDAFNLGSEQGNFESQVLRSRLQKQFHALKHIKRSEDFGFTLNKASSFLAEEYGKKAQMVMEYVSKSEFGAANGLMIRTGLSCEFVRNQIIQDLQADVIKNSDVMVKYLNQLSCKNEISSQDIQLLYEAELIRQFQRYFDDSLLLGFLSHRPNLKSTLWNIDNSGLWMSPKLLMRISWSKDNIHRKEGTCPPPSVVGQKECAFYADDDYGPSDYLSEKAGIKSSNYELIYVSKGKVIGSYRRFKRQSRHNGRLADPLFVNASMYIHRIPYYGELGMPYQDESGEVNYKEEPLQWEVWLQQVMNNYHFENDSFDDAQWEETQEARRKAAEQEEAGKEVESQTQDSGSVENSGPYCSPLDCVELPNPFDSEGNVVAPGSVPDGPTDLPDVE